MNFKKSYVPKKGYTEICTKENCSCKRLCFGMIELAKGDTVSLETAGSEYAFVVLYGHADVQVGGEVYAGVGKRMNVFEGPSHSVYAPRNTTVTFTGIDEVKIAVISTPTDKDSKPQWKKPEEVKVGILGQEPYLREFNGIIDVDHNADYLTVGESFVVPGNYAGFPGHKHDEDNMPAEAAAEEIYYFLFDKEQGFGFQSLYTADGEIDETYRVKNNDITEFPRGYHLTQTALGYKMYILWFMAGDIQGIHRTNDPAHEWVLQA